MKTLFKSIFTAGIAGFFTLLVFCTGCKEESHIDPNLPRVVTTTTQVTDLVRNIGGDKINIQPLMGAGVDPHLYKASEGDVSKLSRSDVVFYSGLHLEGKLADIFEKMKNFNRRTVSLGDSLDRSRLISSELFSSNFDPHVWFDVSFFKRFADVVAGELSEVDPQNAAFYTENRDIYKTQLDSLTAQLKREISQLPEEKRILVTAHDAFSYFGRYFDFKVVGLQGISTATEAGVKDVQNLTQFIIDNNIRAIFIESSVPVRTIEALREAIRSKGHEVNIGGTLYSDALGSPGTDEGTYIGMYKYNVKTIVDALK